MLNQPAGKKSKREDYIASLHYRAEKNKTFFSEEVSDAGAIIGMGLALAVEAALPVVIFEAVKHIDEIGAVTKLTAEQTTTHIFNIASLLSGTKAFNSGLEKAERNSRWDHDDTKSTFSLISGMTAAAALLAVIPSTAALYTDKIPSAFTPAGAVLLATYNFVLAVEAGIDLYKEQKKAEKPGLLQHCVDSISNINRRIVIADIMAKEDPSLLKEVKELQQQKTQLQAEAIVLYKTLEDEKKEGFDSEKLAKLLGKSAEELNQPATNDEKLAANLLITNQKARRDNAILTLARRSIGFSLSMAGASVALSMEGVSAASAFAFPPLLVAGLACATVLLGAGVLGYRSFTHCARRQQEEVVGKDISEYDGSMTDLNLAEGENVSISDLSAKQRKGLRLIQEKVGVDTNTFASHTGEEVKQMCRRAYQEEVNDQLLTKAIKAASDSSFNNKTSQIETVKSAFSPEDGRRLINSYARSQMLFGISDAAKQAANGAVDAISGAANGMANAVSSVVTDMADAVSKSADELASFVITNSI